MVCVQIGCASCRIAHKTFLLPSHDSEQRALQQQNATHMYADRDIYDAAELLCGKLPPQANIKQVAARIQMASLMETILTLSLGIGGILGYCSR